MATNGIIDDTINNNGAVTPPATPQGLLGTTTETTETPSATVISPEAKVSNQLTSLLSSGSPLLALSESKAKEQANRLGLLSSSMAVGAGRRAVIETATPIAAADAATFATRDLAQQRADIDKTLDIQQQEGRTALEEQQQSGRTSLQTAENIAALEREQVSQTGATGRLQLELENKIADTALRINQSDRQFFSESASKIAQQSLAAVADINNQPDTVLTPAQKGVAIANIRAQAQADTDFIASIFEVNLDWGDTPLEQIPLPEGEADRPLFNPVANPRVVEPTNAADIMPDALLSAIMNQQG
ncbi:MAG: hypothetical protein KAS32_18205 [Candidatus Peribacteraceae bacterium]|nr:hypothetical protein [Candidatus Peribacteraceae bacterium]